MPIGHNIARCCRCGKEWIVGDCIPTLCDECEARGYIAFLPQAHEYRPCTMRDGSQACADCYGGPEAPWHTVRPPFLEPAQESDLPELTPEEKQAIESIDMTPILGAPSERLRLAMDSAIRFMRERNVARASEKMAWGEHKRVSEERDKLAAELSDHKARYETSLEVIRSREEQAEQQRVLIERLRAELAAERAKASEAKERGE